MNWPGNPYWMPAVDARISWVISSTPKPRISDYIGVEAVDALATEAEARNYPNCKIVRGDFVREPARLFVGADVIVFSGSLNTIDSTGFYETLVARLRRGGRGGRI